ncbi:MAG: hypothetical protein ABIK13_02910, partial [Patescibacteria group bacterium]
MHTPKFRIGKLFIAAVIICAAFVVFGPETTVAQGINRSVSYQGKLLTASEIPVADGDYAVKFSLYDAESGGNRLWTSSGTTSSPSAVTVTVHSGLFTVQLGDTTAGQNPFTLDWNQPGLYLGVTIAADAEMTPRKRLTSVPYAFVAETLQGQYASSSVDTAGGNLFALHQNATDAATGDRTSLFIATSGTSNLYDYLIKASNGSEVFTVSRLGNVTTTGNFAAAGNVIIGDASSDSVIFNAGVGSNVMPLTTNAFDLGSASKSWNNIYASGTVTASSTLVGFGQVSQPSISFIGDTDTGFYRSGANQLGIVSQGAIKFLIGSTATYAYNPIIPAPTNSLDLGSGMYGWRNVYVSGTHFGGIYNAATGTTSAPAFSFQGDEDTGIYSGGSGNLNFTTNGLMRFAVSSGGFYIALNVTPLSNNSYNLGGPTASFKDIYASGTAYIGTDVKVGLGAAAQSVCLANGTNCPTATAEADTLLTVTNRGSVATSSLILYGGLSTSNLTATGTTSLQGMTFTVATGTSVTTTNLSATRIDFSNATGTNLSLTGRLSAASTTVTTLNFSDATGSALYVSKSVTDNATSTSFYTTNLGASKVLITNATATTLTVSGNFSAGSSTVTTLNFSNATGSSLYISGPTK